MQPTPTPQAPSTVSSSSTLVRKFHHYSSAFHNQKETLEEVSHRATLGFHNLHSSQFKSRTVDLFSQFSAASKAEQRAMLEEDDLYLDSLFDIVINTHSDRDLMEFVLPTIDAILAEEPDIRRRVVAEVVRGKDKTVLGFWDTVKKLDSEASAKLVGNEAAAKILAIGYGEMLKQDQVTSKKEFLQSLVDRKASPSSDTALTNYTYLRCLLYLIKHQELAELYFRSDGGVSNLMYILSGPNTDPQVTYCLILTLLLLSYVDEFLGDCLANPEHGVLKKVLESMQANYREKVVRVAFLLFRKVCEDSKGLELLIDLDLPRAIDNLLKGTLKEQHIIDLIKEVHRILEENTKDLG